MRRRGYPPAAQSDLFEKKQRDHSITATSQQTKAMRGTKRVCHACAARFYDLSRTPIVCPSCGAHYVPEAPVPAATPGPSTSGFTDKAGWRGRRFKRPETEPETESAPDPDIAPEVAAADAAPEETPAPIDDVVLDEEPDEADISGLFDHHETEPRER